MMMNRMTSSHNIKMWKNVSPIILIYYRIKHNFVCEMCEAPELGGKTELFKFCI